MGCALQEPILFSKTLEYNLSYGLNENNEEIIRWASHIAHLSNEIEGFQKKYKTVLGERVSNIIWWTATKNRHCYCKSNS